MALSLSLAPALAAPAPADAARPPATAPGLPVGRYALEIVLATHTRVPVLGVAEGRTTSTVLVEVEPLDIAPEIPERARWWLTNCDVTVEGERGPGRVVVPDAFVDAHGTREAAAVREGGEGRPMWRIDLGAQAVGWDPTLRTTVPRRGRDTGVVDWEGDGRPGGTILLEDIPVFERVEIHVAQLAHLRLWGAEPGGEAAPKDAEPVLAGGVEVLELEQRTLGASVPIFAASLRVRADEAASSFRLLALSPDAGCAEVEAAFQIVDAK